VYARLARQGSVLLDEFWDAQDGGAAMVGLLEERSPSIHQLTVQWRALQPLYEELQKSHLRIPTLGLRPGGMHPLCWRI